MSNLASPFEGPSWLQQSIAAISFSDTCSRHLQPTALLIYECRIPGTSTCPHIPLPHRGRGQGERANRNASRGPRRPASSEVCLGVTAREPARVDHERRRTHASRKGKVQGR